MTKEQLLNDLHKKAEKIGVKNEFSAATLGSIHDIFDGIVKCSDLKEDKEIFTLYEVKSVAKRTETLLNLLSELMQEASDLNEELNIQLMQLKSEEK